MLGLLVFDHAGAGFGVRRVLWSVNYSWGAGRRGCGSAGPGW